MEEQSEGGRRKGAALVLLRPGQLLVRFESQRDTDFFSSCPPAFPFRAGSIGCHSVKQDARSQLPLTRWCWDDGSHDPRDSESRRWRFLALTVSKELSETTDRPDWQSVAQDVAQIYMFLETRVPLGPRSSSGGGGRRNTPRSTRSLWKTFPSQPGWFPLCKPRRTCLASLQNLHSFVRLRTRSFPLVPKGLSFQPGLGRLFCGSNLCLELFCSFRKRTLMCTFFRFANQRSTLTMVCRVS